MKKTPATVAALLSVLLGGASLVACDRESTLLGDALAGEEATPARAEITADAGGTNEAGAPRPSATAPYAMTVYKSPTCGCCKAWVDYMGDEGFAVRAVDTDAVDAIKAEHGLESPALKSCHTAIVDGYVIEGHVPADDVRRLLAERPEGVLGLTAPGMPMMSPGMGSREPKGYDVLAFDEDGDARVWSSY